MRVLLQRVTRASVRVVEPVNDQGAAGVVGAIGPGLVLLVGVGPEDQPVIAERMAEKVAHLRIFNDAEGRFNLSLLDVQGGALVISQFTLFADARQGRRPSFTGAGAPQHAAPLCDHFAQSLRQLGVTPVETGSFGAHMRVDLENDGPVTIWLNSDELGLSPMR